MRFRCLILLLFIFSLQQVLLEGKKEKAVYLNYPRVRRDTVSEEFRKWPGGIVPYSYGHTAGILERKVFQQAIREIESVSCVKFVKRNVERDYVRLVSGEGCYSVVGREIGRQDISLGPGCRTKGVAIHEILHTLGFYHEQSRADRDKHVTILFQNVYEGSKRQFKKYAKGVLDTQNQPYDPESIMHYSNEAFSKNGKKTLVYKIDPSRKLGQRKKLSSIDIIQLRKLYRCPLNRINTTTNVTVQPPIRIDTCRDNATTGYCFIGGLSGMCFYSPQIMAHFCPKTCGFCRPTCYDISAFCEYFLFYKYCHRNENVRQRCKKTCGVCKVA